MPNMELAFEYMSLALQGTRWTAESTPDTLANLTGMLRWREAWYEPDDSDGNLAQSRGERRTREWCEWSGEGPLDTAVLPYYLEMITKGGISPSTPGGATASRLWEYDPDLTADSIEAATIWWGDPNVEEWYAETAFAQELRIVNDATGTGGATMSVRGVGTWPTADSPTNPAADVDPVIVPMNMQLWIDTSSGIGTTEITGRLLRAEHVIPSGIMPKFIPTGAGTDLTFSDIGFRKRQGNNRAMTRLRLEVPDTTQFDQFEAETEVKLRVRHNGPLIEAGFYYYVEVDMYGKLRFQDWGTAFETNRVINLELYSNVDATLGADYRVAVQNQETSL